ncbi:uncharacterized mitochondrial protein AtMg00810-like [Rutidosis leptorrhynchoides]|uniref:uncharacterized mitochondrial protein AtMg00810-like n=1 Tax=Rutidosis leptorrhynchoides TaxID=125765 RepID=UPI003A997727
MKDLSPISYFLGISVHRTNQRLFLNQTKYAKEILERAGIPNRKMSKTHVDNKSKLSSQAGPPYSNITLYRSLARALQYLTLTRPDISYVVQQICLHMHDPHKA